METSILNLQAKIQLIAYKLFFRAENALYIDKNALLKLKNIAPADNPAAKPDISVWSSVEKSPHLHRTSSKDILVWCKE